MTAAVLRKIACGLTDVPEISNAARVEGFTGLAFVNQGAEPWV